MIVTGFIDEKGDGPSPKDPQGRVEIEVAEVALTDLTLELRSDNAPSIPTPPDQQPNTPGEGAAEQQPAGNAGAAPAPAQGAPKADAPEDAPKEEAAPAGPPAKEIILNHECCHNVLFYPDICPALCTCKPVMRIEQHAPLYHPSPATSMTTDPPSPPA